MSMLLNAVSGLNAANAGLLVAGQNTANAAVKGYSRQTVYLDTASGGLNGVKVTKIDRIVNDYLNNDIWRTSADLNYYQGFQTYLGYHEELLGTESLNLNNSVADMKTALNAALATPESPAYRQQFISSADALAQKLAQINGALEGQQLKLSKELSDLSDNASSLTSQIADLNAKISKAQALGEPTAQLKDAREEILTELSSYIGIDVLNQADGTVNVTALNGAPLIIGSKSSTLSVNGSAVTATFNNQDFPLSGAVGGRIGGLLSVASDILQPVRDSLNSLIVTIADSVNNALADGFDLNDDPGRPLFAYNPADPLGTIRITDITTDELAFRGNDAGAPSGGKGDNGNIANIINSMNGSTAGYDVLIGDLAIQSKQIQSSAKAALILNDNAIAARDNLSGVNLDEEAASILLYQKLYDANAKVISTADQMFKTLINMF